MIADEISEKSSMRKRSNKGSQADTLERSGSLRRPTEGNLLVEICIHVANVFYLVSFLGRDMLWLRALTCVGLLLGVVFFSCQKTPMYGPTVWHVVFLVINVIQIRGLLLERRQLRLTEEQERLGEAAFHNLSREELLTLLTHVMTEKVTGPRDVHRVCHQQLSQDERVLRDLAFSHLTRKELLNLVTRRLWKSLTRQSSGRGITYRMTRVGPPSTPPRSMSREVRSSENLASARGTSRVSDSLE